MASPKPELSLPCSSESSVQDTCCWTMASPKPEPLSPCSSESAVQDNSYCTIASPKPEPSSSCSSESSLQDPNICTMAALNHEASYSAATQTQDSSFVDILNMPKIEPVVPTDSSLSSKIISMSHSKDPLVPEISKATYYTDTILLDMSVTPSFGDIKTPKDTKNRLKTEEILSQWNFRKLFSQLGTQYQCVQFAAERGLILKEKICQKHRKPMTLQNQGQLGTFNCRKSTCRYKQASISRARGTFFENAHLDIVVIFQLMYLFSHGYSYEQAIWETASVERGTTLSPPTVSHWYNSCREAIITYEMTHQTAKGKIGGLHKVVHIDHSKFGRRTHKKGKKIEGQWVIGMSELGSDELRLDVCPGNEICIENLVPLIKKHIEEGSIIQANYLRPYSCLSEHGYLFRKTNDSNGCSEQIDINPEKMDCGIKLEDQWARLGKAYKRNPYVKNFADWLVEYTWRYKIKTQHKDPFEELLNAVKFVYS
ncbi:uncharacterized protein [Maniola hyperantus]|uniref:uncharacterized protein n=1 Tax=Aphantopus hyperantus TaxID=2795564 RepID=UPI00212201C7